MPQKSATNGGLNDPPQKMEKKEEKKKEMAKNYHLKNGEGRGATALQFQNSLTIIPPTW